MALQQLHRFALAPLRLTNLSLRMAATETAVPNTAMFLHIPTATPFARIPRLSWAARTYASVPPLSSAKTTASTTKTRKRALDTSPKAPPVAAAVTDRPKKRLPKDPHLMSQRVLKLSRQGKLDEAIVLVKDSPYSLQNEVVWNHLIDESGRLGRVNLALKLMSDMKKRGFEPTERTYTIILKTLANNPSSPETVSRAKELYARMQEHDITPNLLHTNALLKVFGRAGDIESMQKMFNKMPRQGPQAPDTITFNTVLGAYGQRQDGLLAGQAWRVWDSCLEAKIQRPDMIDIDERLLGSLMVAVRHSEQHADNGLKVVESLYGIQLDSDSSKKVKKETDQPQQSLEHARRNRSIYPSEALGLGPVLAHKMPSFRTIDLVLQLAATARRPVLGHAFVDWVWSKYPDFVPDMPLLTTLVQSYTESRSYAKAIACFDLYHKHRLPEPTVVFYQCIMEALYGARDRTPKSFELIKEAMRLAEDGSLLRRDGRAARGMDAMILATYGKHCKREGRWEEGRQVLDLVHWQDVIAQCEHGKANHGIAQLAIYVLREDLKDLKKELRRDEYLQQEQRHAAKSDEATERGLAASASRTLSKADKALLREKIERRERELELAQELEKEWAKKRYEKGIETRKAYRERTATADKPAFTRRTATNRSRAD